MTRMITACLALAGVFAAGPALAHHAASVLGTVRITQPVLADGKLLQPGTYEIRLTGEHVMPLPGQFEDAEQWVEFVRDGVVIGRDVAEVFPSGERTVETSGSPARGAARVEMLRGGDFLRVSAHQDGARYLIYLPIAAS